MIQTGGDEYLSKKLQFAHNFSKYKTTDGFTLFLNVSIAVLLWLACALDLAWPVWTQLAVQPSFLDLTFVLATFFCRPRMIVFWGGVAGLLTSIIHVQPVQFCLPVSAAIATITALRHRESPKFQTMTARLSQSLLLLVALATLRSGGPALSLDGPMRLLSRQQLAGVALTFLFSTMICFALVSVRRRELWSD